MTIDMLIFLGFLSANLILGLASGQGVKNIKEYAVGDRKFSTATIVSTIVATWISGNYFFGQASEACNSGLYSIWGNTLSDLVAFLLMAFVFTPRMAEFLGKLSIADAMGGLYGDRVRVLTAISSFIGIIGVISIELKAAGIAFEYIFGIPSTYGSVIAGILITFYSAMGGIKSVTFTDVIQFITFGVVIPVIVYFLLNSIDGIVAITDLMNNNPAFNYKEVFDFSRPKSLYFLFFFFFNAVPGFSPAMFQRVAMSSSTGQASRSFAIASVTCFTLGLTICLIAVLTMTAHPGLNPQDVIKVVIDDYSHVIGLKGLILAGVMSMIMSSIDSYINASAVIITHDFFKPLKIDFKNELSVARSVSFIIGSVAIALSLRQNTFLNLLVSAYSFYMPIVTVPFMMAVFGFRSTEKPVILGMLSGLFTVLIWNYFEIQVVDNIIPAMSANLFVLLSSHYMLKQKGGFVGIKDPEPLLKIRKQRRLKFQAFLSDLKSFNLLNACKKNAPNSEGHIAIFGFFVMVVAFSSVSTLSKAVHDQYSYIIDILYPLTLCSSTTLISYPLWLQKWKNSNIVGVVWNVIMFAVLICFSCLMVFISNFSEVQLTVFLVNVIVISSIVRWQWALFHIVVGVSLVTFLYTSYLVTGVDGYQLELVSQFKIIYVLLLIVSSLVLFVKPKQSFQELTEQKAHYFEDKVVDHEEELKRLVALKNELLANVNHEVRTPITGITSLGQILDERYEKFSESKRREVIRDIANSSVKLQALIDNIFDLSKISSMNHDLQKTAVNLTDMIYACTERCKKICNVDPDRQEIVLNLQENVIATCDGYYIRRTIENLIENSIKYCANGKIVISLNTADESVEFSISDEGIGIPKNEIYDVFGTFIVSSKTKTPAGGRGIGLALCKKTIELHQGRIWVESDGIKGAVFKFTLPVQ